ncbi:(2Fe-2S)-binding protein [Dictyobacter arantiisoli]|uniref:Carbon monoxide dehydrogenase n=1 Tax=Dictyobacter arantiisoli TaxID=2014874 RepID=A0A5A5T8Z6_9CHLR|nr:(2Fe-2S)-binding protein [Dictyobacter arantiisoli]GCF07960.1 carbon monoxide dehydrogenase [Dictyobacter arantiisoli]
MKISLTVNGTQNTANVEPRILLVDFIRDTLNLTGTKLGCDTGQCGTCVIQVNGKPVKSCSMLAVQVDGCDVKTIEGVSQHGQLNTLQQSLWEKHGLQCGFCTPGMIMTLLDFLQHNEDPSEDEIRSCLEGHLCRCTGYHSVVRAVRDAVVKARQTQSADLLVGSAD